MSLKKADEFDGGNADEIRQQYEDISYSIDSVNEELFQAKTQLDAVRRKMDKMQKPETIAEFRAIGSKLKDFIQLLSDTQDVLSKGMDVLPMKIASKIAKEHRIVASIVASLSIEAKEQSNHAGAATMIRDILKKAFPRTKFRIRARSYSMGSSVDVYWTDGPTSKEVEPLIKHHEYGEFDGMTDSYNYTNRREDIPQVKFVMTQRDMSPEVKEKIENELSRKFDLVPNAGDDLWYKKAGDHLDILVRREFNKRSF